MEKLKSDTVQPLYLQLSESIKNHVKEGKYKHGDKIPSEEQLGDIYGVSRITVRSAVTYLVEEGVLIKKHGKGTFVAMPTYVESMSSAGSFTKSCIQNNTTPSTTLVSVSNIKANKDLSKYLGIEKDDNVICVRRVRNVDGIPTIFEEDYFIKDFNFLFKEDLEHKPLSDIINKNTGYSTEKFENYFAVSRATKEIANYLDTAIGYPLLKIDQVVLGKENNIIYFNIQYIITEKYTCTFTTYK